MCRGRVVSVQVVKYAHIVGVFNTKFCTRIARRVTHHLNDASMGVCVIRANTCNVFLKVGVLDRAPGNHHACYCAGVGVVPVDFAGKRDGIVPTQERLPI